MKRSRRLLTLVKLAGMAENAARQRLARANQELIHKQQQQRLLQSYDDEYSERWIETGRRGISGAELHRIGAFRTSLGATIKLQESQVAQSREGVARSASTWAGQRGQLRIFTELQQRARKLENAAADKREQRTVDDLVAKPRTRLL
jgi:flagellar protein FliJ